MANPRSNGHQEKVEASQVFGWQTPDRPDPFAEVEFDSSGVYSSSIQAVLGEIGFIGRVRVQIKDNQVYYVIDDLIGEKKNKFISALTKAFYNFQLSSYDLLVRGAREGDAGVAIPESSIVPKKKITR